MSPDSNPAAPPGPTTLESLRHYASSQTKLIESALESPHLFKTPDNFYWMELWRATWGKDPDSFDKPERVESGPDSTNNSLIFPGVVPSNRNVMSKPDVLNNCWGPFECKKIFIRSEYKEAEEFLLSICGSGMDYDAVVIAGQPGIGKSVFLVRTLLRRLALELPTALQIYPDHALLFYQGGVKEFVHLYSRAMYNCLSPEGGTLARIWALVDSGQELKEPSPVFKGDPFFVVETLSSCPTRSEWTRRIRCEPFYMKQWAFSEVLQVRDLIKQNRSENQLWYMHDKYGASLRSLLLSTGDPDQYEGFIKMEAGRLSLERLIKILGYGCKFTDASDLLISTDPSPTGRTRSERSIVSKYVLEIIWKVVLKGKVEKLRELYDLLRDKPAVSTAAGMIFEFRVHQLLQEGRILDLFSICGRISDEGINVIYDKHATTNPACVTLPKLKESLFANEAEIPFEVGTYYRPQNTNFPSIDSWVPVQLPFQEDPILFLFRITLNMTKHNVKKSDLDRIDKFGKGVQKCLVVITPTGVQPDIIVPWEDHLKNKSSSGVDPNLVFPVFHHQINYDELFPPLSL